MKYEIKLKRVYDEVEESDGYRVLVDRLWPRGIKKENLKMDSWPKAITPSTELRKAFKHEPEQFPDFVNAYRKELDDNPEKDSFLEDIRQQLKSQPVTLLTATKEMRYNQAVVLKDWLADNL